MSACQRGNKKAERAGKGISPLVAAVLLIAVTMTIAGILAWWAGSFVRTSLPEVNETEVECRFAEFSIYSCSYVNSTGSLNIILENLENTELKELKLYAVYGDGTLSNEISLNETLNAGSLQSYTITGITWPFSLITVKTHCAELSRSKSCKLIS